MPVNQKDRPNTATAIQFVESKWGLKAYGWRATGSVPGSLHPLGRALDIMTTNVGLGDQIAQWFIANRNVFGTIEVIWRNRIWTPARGWHDYFGPSPHTDHLHVSLGEQKSLLGKIPIVGDALGGAQNAIAGAIGGAVNDIKKTAFMAAFGLGGIALLVLGAQQSIAPTVRKAIGV